MHLIPKAAVLLGIIVTLFTSAGPPTASASDNAQIIRDGFARGVGGPESFYALLAEDVRWTVARAEGAATYTNRQEFLDRGAKPVLDRLTGPIQAQIHDLVVDGDRVVALWRGTAQTIDGHPYVNEYAWSMTMTGGQISTVVAYLDLVALDDLISRIPL